MSEIAPDGPEQAELLSRTVSRSMEPSRAGQRPTVALVLSVDTEEDNWVPARAGISVANVPDALPTFADRASRLGIRPTFFTSYRVARDPAASAVLRSAVSRTGGEVAVHVHPWNTPPYCGIEDRTTMLYAYPAAEQRAKIASVLEAIRANMGTEPVAFRAGRFGIGRTTVRALADAGLQVDSSVTPLLNWRDAEGPSFLDAENRVYLIGSDRNACYPSPSGELMEIPITVGYTRLRPQSWNAFARLMDSAAARGFRLPAVSGRLFGIRKVILSPEAESRADMVRLGKHMVRNGAAFLHMFFHSPSLVPGLTPFTRTSREVDRIYERISEFVESMAAVANLRFMTVSEAAVALAGARGRASPSGEDVVGAKT